MSILVLKLPDVKRKRAERPRECPYCQGETFQRWRRVKKPVREDLSALPGLITDLPPEGDRRLYALWKQAMAPGGRRTGQYTPLDPLRDLLIRLSETWPSFCTFYSDPAIPWTNNTTEQVIGRMKMRARTVRGTKTWPGMQTGLMLAGTSPD